MNRTLLLTGATGALGVPLLVELLRARTFDRIFALTRGDPAALIATLRAEAPDVDLAALTPLVGELGVAKGLAALDGHAASIDCVVHAAALTKFRAPVGALGLANIEATRQLLAWAAAQSRPPRLIHLSTTCVAGPRTGEIAEVPLVDDRGFLNDYEHTKWRAEQLVTASRLRPEIVRLATVVGSARDGRLRRPGAFHTTLRWLHGGLLPMVPGDEATRLDLLPTELATGFISRLLARPPQPGGIYHLSAGAEGVPLAPLLALAAERFARGSAAWRSGQILPPVLATHATFTDFRDTITRSRDFLFTQVLESVDSFLPELFYPKCYLTANAARVWGGPLPIPEWRDWLARVIDHAVETNFGRA